jgi:hypothetical protein
MRGFDKEAINSQLLLGLPFVEGTGIITQDIAKPHHPVALTNTPTWTTLASGLQVLDFNAAIPEFLESPTVSTADLDFTSGDFSVAIWAYIDSLADIRELFCRGLTTNDGWRIFIMDDGRLGIQTNQAAAAQTSLSAVGEITINNWGLLSASRSGTRGRVYKNGQDVTVTAPNHINPLTSARKLHVGIYDTEAHNPFDGKMWNPRIWGRKLEPWEHMALFNAERQLFGV